MTSRPADTGNRAFWTLLAATLVFRVLLAYGVCCLALVVLTVVRDDGAAALWTSRPDLIPGVLLLALAGAGALNGVWSLGNSLWHTRSFARAVRRDRVPAPPELRALADRLRIGSRIRVIVASCPFALTYGLRRTRVLVTTGLLASLTEQELAAVLAHERAHVRNRDPLKNVITRMLPARHFYLPGMGRLRHRFTVGRELAADRAAIAHRGPAALAGALLKVAAGPAWAKSVPTAAMASDELLAMRITQLETGAEPPQPRPGPMARAATVVSVAAFAAACVWSAFVVAQVMPGCAP